MWGFITCLNDILIPHLKNAFDLTFTQAMLIQLCFFGSYFLVSLPAGWLVKRIGYQRGVVTGLVIAAVGCVGFFPAAQMQVYALFLGALFVLAGGITVLQVAANPYVTLLGPEETASSRLNLTQAFNSLGTTLAPLFGASLILSSIDSADATASVTSVQLPYLGLAAALLAIAVGFALIRLPKISDIEVVEAHNDDGKTSAWQYPHLVLGTIGIFVYVGAEVSVGSFLISFIGQPDIAGLQEADAAIYVTLFWGGAMLGRFAGALIMRTVPAAKVLLFNASLAAVLLVIGITTQGYVALWAVVLLGLCNSIMFPTIFSTALRGLGQHTSEGSGILCMAIVGGAIIPLAQGVLADSFSIQASLVLPVICYAYIGFYALRCRRDERLQSAAA